MTRVHQPPNACYRFCDIERQVGRHAIRHPAPIEIQITGDLKKERYVCPLGVTRTDGCVALTHLLIDDIWLNLAQRTPQLCGVEQGRAAPDPRPGAYTADRIGQV